MPEASAPGKLLLCGEYAVLCGAPAVAVALGARARATVAADATSRLRTPDGDYPFRYSVAAGLRWSAADPGRSGALLRALLAELPRHCTGLRPRAVSVSLDSRAFVVPASGGRGQKLGLGSSAAVLAALAGALTRAWGLDLPADDFDALCLGAHRAFQQGRGSGVDVLTAIHGRVVAVRPGTPPEISLLNWPGGLHMVVVWSGRPASTPAMIDAFRQFRQAREDSAGPCLEALARAAESAAQAWRRGSPDTIIEATRAYAGVLAELDDAAGIGILTPQHRRLRDLAADAGAVYKTSGAGGGDLGFALTDREAVAAELRRRFTAAGFGLVELPLAADGLSVRR